MKSIILATRNPHKVIEISNILKASGNFTIKTLNEYKNIPDIIESGRTFQENAILKAEGIGKFTNHITIADDSGLEVDALSGRPGIYSARFAGENSTDAQNTDKLLKLIDSVIDEKRTARFKCVMALYIPSESKTLTFEGCVEGIILHNKTGDNGFGYDPVFYYPPLKKSFAQLSQQTKNAISHRGEALSKLGDFLEKNIIA